MRIEKDYFALKEWKKVIFKIMFKKFNTTTLIIIFVCLGSIALFNKFYQSEKDERTFREEFVTIDTAAVISISIFPKVENGKEIKMTKNGQKWELQNDKIKTNADSKAIRSLLSEFSKLKSVGLAGQDKSTWKDLQVNDSTGTKIKIMTNDNHTYSMVIGKLEYSNSSGNGLSYIRHSDEKEVYSVQGYLSLNVNQPFNTWRNKIFITGNQDNWTTFSFSYPGDSSFTLNKIKDYWFIDEENADQDKAKNYISQLVSMQSSGFVDGYSPSSTPVFKITINGGSPLSKINIQAYLADSTQKYILHSSLNPDAYFSEAQSNLADKLFIGKKYLLK